MTSNWKHNLPTVLTFSRLALAPVILAVLITSSIVCWCEEPFWRAKEKVYSRIQNREIVVSVRAAPRTSGMKNLLSIAGGGQVDAPCAFVFAASKDFEAFARQTGYVDRAKFDPVTQILEARLSAYGLKADIAFKMVAGDSAMTYAVLKGPMTGMKGEFKFIPAGAAKCDVGIDGEFAYDKFPVPQFFLSFGMEVMLQRMAGRLRSYSEELYQKKGVVR